MRFIIRKFIEAESMEKALKAERRTRPHEIYLDNEVWKNRDYALKDRVSGNIGYDNRARQKPD